MAEQASGPSSSLRDVARTMVLSGAGLGLAVVMSVVLARALGPEGRGAYAVVYRAIGILIAFAQLGLPEVLLLQMKAGRRRPSELAANIILIIMATTALAAILLWAIYPLLATSFLQGVGRGLAWLAFSMLPFNLSFLFFTRLIQLDGRLGAYNVLLLAASAFNLIGVIVFLAMRPGDPTAAVLGLVASSVLMALPAVALARMWVATGPWRVDLPLLGESVRNGVKVQWGMLAHIVAQYSGVFVLNRFLDLKSVGWYATALGLATMILLVSQAARTVLQSWMPQAGSDVEQAARRTAVFARHTLVALTVVTVLLVASGYPAIRLLYGAEFGPAYAPMTILVVGMVARGIGQIVSSQLAFGGHLILPSWAAVLALLTSVGMMWVLIPLAGISGAALGTTMGQLASLAFLVFWFVKKTGVEFRELVPRASDARVYAGMGTTVWRQVRSD